jgi:LacI family transcriptional regulator
MREVADAAGVAMSSVSRVLSGHPDVSPHMRERVMTAVDELRYRPNLLAQGLRSQQTFTVGFLVGDISNPLMAEMVKGAVGTLREGGYSTILTDSERDPDLDTVHLGLFEQRRVDGLILSLSREDHPTTIEALSRLRVPAVLIDRDLPESIEVDRILSDHQIGMRAALNHLMDLGHRRIGLIVGLPVRATAERKAAFEATYNDRHLDPSYLIIESEGLSFEEGLEGARALLDDSDPPTAIIVGGNQLVFGALTEIRSRGLRIPQDLSIVTSDDTAVTALHSPPIATVRRQNIDLGTAAATLLLDRMAANALEQDRPGSVGEFVPQEITLPTEFVARESCGPAPQR